MHTRFYLAAALLVGLAAPAAPVLAESMYRNDDCNAVAGCGATQYKITYETSYVTKCHDETKYKEVNSGRFTCTIRNPITSKSADFAGSGGCDSIMEQVSHTEPVCVSEKVVTEVRTPIKNSGSNPTRGDGGQGDSPGR